MFTLYPNMKEWRQCVVGPNHLNLTSVTRQVCLVVDKLNNMVIGNLLLADGDMLYWIHHITFIQLHSLHCINYISLITLHSLHCIHYIAFITLHSLHCICYVTFVTLHKLHYIHYIAFIILHSLHYIAFITLHSSDHCYSKLWNSLITDHPTDEHCQIKICYRS